LAELIFRSCSDTPEYLTVSFASNLGIFTQHLTSDKRYSFGAEYSPTTRATPLIHQHLCASAAFQLLAVISAHKQRWLREVDARSPCGRYQPSALAKYGYFGSRYFGFTRHSGASNAASGSLVCNLGSVLTTHTIAPHLTHAPTLNCFRAVESITQFPFIQLEYILPGCASPRRELVLQRWSSTCESTQKILNYFN